MSSAIRLRNTDGAVAVILLNALDVKKIKENMKASIVLGFTYDLASESSLYSGWEDAKGNAIFGSSMGLEIKGKTYYGDPDGVGKLEKVVPNKRSNVELRLFQ